MKASTEGTVISFDFEDGKSPVELDVASLNQEVKDAGLLFGMRTVMRNATAGKMEEVEKARAAMESRVQLFKSGKWQTEGETRAAVELSSAEKDQIVKDAIVLYKKSKGDQREPAAILAAFAQLDGAIQQRFVDSLGSIIKTRMKAMLKDKKSAGKVKGGDDTDF